MNSKKQNHIPSHCKYCGSVDRHGRYMCHNNDVHRDNNGQNRVTNLYCQRCQRFELRDEIVEMRRRKEHQKHGMSRRMQEITEKREQLNAEIKKLQNEMDHDLTMATYKRTGIDSKTGTVEHMKLNLESLYNLPRRTPSHEDRIAVLESLISQREEEIERLTNELDRYVVDARALHDEIVHLKDQLALLADTTDGYTSLTGTPYCYRSPQEAADGDYELMEAATRFAGEAPVQRPGILREVKLLYGYSAVTDDSGRTIMCNKHTVMLRSVEPMSPLCEMGHDTPEAAREDARAQQQRRKDLQQARDRWNERGRDARKERRKNDKSRGV